MRNHRSSDELGRELRQGETVFIKRRRGIIGLAFFSCAVLGVVALYQIGILKKLPQPRAKAFDTRKVNGSAQAYAILEIPDAFLGLGSYAVTAALASMGAENRWRTRPWIALAMGGKLLLDSAMAGKLTVDEFTKLRAFSVWSILTALATWTALPLAFPETRAAFRQVAGGERSLTRVAKFQNQ